MLNLKCATHNDVESIRQLLRENNLPHQDFGPHLELFFAISEHTISGVVGVERYSPNALFRSLAVADSHKNMGLGKQLTVFMLDYLAANGVMEVFLLTTTAEKFFEKMGFKRIDREKVPPVIAQTKEFSEICPDSAVCMQYVIY